MQNIALLVFVGFILCHLVREAKRRPRVSPALWVVFIWLVNIGARSVSTWMDVGREIGNEAQSYDTGNPLERSLYFVLIVAGLAVLSRRGVRLGEVFRENKWIAIFFLYWLCSTIWAELPLVAFKRWVKDLGNVIMVLVILTDRDPIAAVKSVFVRTGCVLIPLSVLFIRYYPDLGRGYHPPTGEMMFTGVATHKNTLGILVMVFGLFIMWDLVSSFRDGAIKLYHKTVMLLDVPLCLMTVWLLYTSHSATSLACAVIGAAIFFGMRMRMVQKRIPHMEVYAVLLGVGYWVANSVFDLTRVIVEDVLGRNMTLTTRTEVWPILLEQADSPLIGSGFMSFWTGARLERLFEEYMIIQAHNGYLEVYLNGGLIAIGLLVVLLLAANKRIKQELLQGGEFTVVQFMFLVIAIIHNFTEASISKGGLIWFVLLLAITRYSASSTVPAAAFAPTGSQRKPSPWNTRTVSAAGN